MISLAQIQSANPSAQSVPSAPTEEQLMSGLRPLKPAIEIPVEPEPTPHGLIVGSIVGVVFLALMSWLIWKGTRQKSKMTAEEIALKSLDDLTGEEWQNDDFIMNVSHIVKAYLEEKELFSAAPQTTEEFLISLKNSDKIGNQRETLQAFFEQCDLVKFAGGHLADEQRKELVETTRSLVEGIAQSESNQT